MSALPGAPQKGRGRGLGTGLGSEATFYLVQNDTLEKGKALTSYYQYYQVSRFSS